MSCAVEIAGVLQASRCPIRLTAVWETRVDFVSSVFVHTPPFPQKTRLGVLVRCSYLSDLRTAVTHGVD